MEKNLAILRREASISFDPKYYTRKLTVGLTFTATLFALEHVETGFVRPMFIMGMILASLVLPFTTFLLERFIYLLLGAKIGLFHPWWLTIFQVPVHFLLWLLSIPLMPFSTCAVYFITRKQGSAET